MRADFTRIAGLVSLSLTLLLHYGNAGSAEASATMTGMDDKQENLGPAFIKAADNNPLRPDMLLQEAPEKWPEIVKGHPPPADLAVFENTMNRQLDRLVDWGVKQIGKQCDLAKMSPQNSLAETLSPAYIQNIWVPMRDRIRDINKTAKTEDQRDQQIQALKDGLGDLKQGIRNSYGERLNEVMESLRNPSLAPESGPAAPSASRNSWVFQV